MAKNSLLNAGALNSEQTMDLLSQKGIAVEVRHGTSNVIK
jgi:hypothetical protein